jgi:hypothetical protein
MGAPMRPLPPSGGRGLFMRTGCLRPCVQLSVSFFIVFNFVDAMWRFSLCYRSVARFRRVQFCSKMHFCHSGPRWGGGGVPPFSGLSPVPCSMVRSLSMPERNMANTTIRGGGCRYVKKVSCLLIPMLPERNRAMVQRCGRRLQYLKKKWVRCVRTLKYPESDLFAESFRSVCYYLTTINI